MKQARLALICSGLPGFFRAAAHALGDRFRLMESLTFSETTQMALMHEPDLIVIDGRNLSASQTHRLQALFDACRRGRLLFITRCDGFTPAADALPAGRFQRGITGADDDPERAIRAALQEADSVPFPPAAATRESPEASSSTGVVRGQFADAVHPGHVAAACHAASDAFADRLVGAKHDCSGGPDSDGPASRRAAMADLFRTRTPEVRHMLRRLEVAARHNVTLLLIGETGSGKTHLAGMVHDLSTRQAEPFVHVACGALPGELIESELFGHVKGAFTSAHADKVGKFVAAGRGTILLDEIDVLTPDQQVKLLRVIETGEFEPVGSNQTLRVQARVIAASNLQLQPLVSQGQFRPDLYYRLNTLSFTIPPLRRRLPDIEPLARYFVYLHAAQHGIHVEEIASDFIECLLQYPWPGNVREMENAIRSAVIYCADGRITAETLPEHIVAGQAGPTGGPPAFSFHPSRSGDSLGERIELTEKDIIEQALFNHNYSRTNTARHLGISRVTLYNKMRKHGIVPDR